LNHTLQQAAQLNMNELHDEFDCFISAYSPDVIAVASAARNLITSTFPELLEIVDTPSKIVAYGFSNTYAGLVCAVAPHNKHVNLMLARGAVLPDPDKLLQGTGKKARHIRLATPEDVNHPGVLNLLKAAVDRHEK